LDPAVGCDLATEAEDLVNRRELTPTAEQTQIIDAVSRQRSVVI
jgi:hypothetical protein